jgi:hypothetical protein
LARWRVTWNESRASDGTNQTNYLEGLLTRSRSAFSKDVICKPIESIGFFFFFLFDLVHPRRAAKRLLNTRDHFKNMLIEFFSLVAEKKTKKETTTVFSCLCLLFICSLMSFRCPIWLFACYVFFLLRLCFPLSSSLFFASAMHFCSSTSIANSRERERELVESIHSRCVSFVREVRSIYLRLFTRRSAPRVRTSFCRQTRHGRWKLCSVSTWMCQSDWISKCQAIWHEWILRMPCWSLDITSGKFHSSVCYINESCSIDECLFDSKWTTRAFLIVSIRTVFSLSGHC